MLNNGQVTNDCDNIALDVVRILFHLAAYIHRGKAAVRLNQIKSCEIKCELSRNDLRIFLGGLLKKIISLAANSFAREKNKTLGIAKKDLRRTYPFGTVCPAGQRSPVALFFKSEKDHGQLRQTFSSPAAIKWSIIFLPGKSEFLCALRIDALNFPLMSSPIRSRCKV